MISNKTRSPETTITYCLTNSIPHKEGRNYPT